MRILSFAVLLAISAVFLSCSSEPEVNGPMCKIAAKQGEVPDGYKKMDGYKELDELDPSCKSEQKKFVSINDTNTLRPPENLDSLVDECSKGAISMEEVIACKDKIWEYVEIWLSEHKKRDLQIPCVAVEGVNWWGAWLTDEEIAELVEIHGVLYFDSGEPVNMEDGGIGIGVDGDYIKGLDSYKELDPICKTEQKNLVSFSDNSPPKIDWDYVYSHLPGYVPGSGQVLESGSGSYSGGQSSVSYNVNGIEMNADEFFAYRTEVDRKYGEELDKNKITIQCTIYSIGYGSGVALLTDEEIAELKKTNSNLIIEDYTSDAAKDGGNGAIPQTNPTGSGENDRPRC